MPVYEIEQYELHSSVFRVEADSQAEAVPKVLGGGGELIDDSPQIIEVTEDFGLPVDDHWELADSLRTLGVTVGEAVVPSIRHIEVKG